MKKSKIFSSIVALALVVTLFTSCGFANKTASSDQTSEDKTDVSISQSAGVTNLTTKKLFAFDGKVNDLYVNALVYLDSSKSQYGIRTYSGKDTGAIYDYCVEQEGMFVVSDNYNKYQTEDTVSSFNVFGLCDGSGEALIGCEYACFEKMNDRYVRAYKATEKAKSNDKNQKTIDKGKYFVSKSSGTGYLYETTVFDLVAGQFVDASQIKYYNGSDTNKKSFKDGSYLISTTETDTVYGIDDEVLFTYNPNEYQISSYVNGYYVAQKVVNGSSVYSLLDKSGKAVSAEFDNRISDIYGKMLTIYSDSSYFCYWFDGTPVLNGKYGQVYYDELSKDLWILKNDKNYTFINGSGAVLLDVKEKGDFKVNASDGLARQENSFYNFETKDYSISAYSTSGMTDLIVEVSDGDSRYDLIDVTNGQILCEGYESSYKYSKSTDGCCYIAAPRIEGGYDIYKVQNKIDAVKNSLADDAIISENQLLKIYETKELMFAELETALKDAGLSASINRDSGEIAFDAAVVFAGDSAEISDGGKKLLDTFVKAYGTVLGNEKYKNFISKTVVEGHTAPLATSTYESGLPLSQSRADNVKDYCKTINASLVQNFEAKGYSNSMPIYNLDGTINQEASRRVTFKCVINNEF